MSASVDWGRLVEQGRAHSIGRGWNEQELNAIYKEKVPVEYVRSGVLTQEEFLKVSSQQESAQVKSPRYMKKEELIALAKAKNPEFDVEAMTRSDLILFLTPVTE